jgi:hypothetical protein
VPGEGEFAGLLTGVEGAGRGGISRGPGAAPLNYQHETKGATDELEARKLPPGRTIPREWTVVGVQRVLPQVNPVRGGGGGGAAATGGGSAAVERRLAPRHRDIVRRFFTERGK